MASSRDDFLMRTIQQLASALERAAGLRGAGDLDAAREALENASREQFGGLATLLPQLDVETAVRLLASPERMTGWVRVLAEQAEQERARGNPDAAARMDARALELLLEAAGEQAHELPEWARELADRVPAAAIGAAYRARLQALRG
ncbi:MAG TPA: hypothetical protein VFL93_09515 [Longimicrobiaceae bacterium]|nr:hypothetical protein [Longimicrobiaceae bacterium]